MGEAKETADKLWQDCLRWAQEKDGEFRARLAAAGVGAGDVQTLDKLPLVPLQEVLPAEASPLARLTLPLSGILRLQGSTPYLREELQPWAEHGAAWLRACGLTLASVLLVADGLDGEGPAWGVLRGAEDMGATVVSLAARPWEAAWHYGASACALTAPLLERWLTEGDGPGPCRAFFCLTTGVTDAQRARWQEQLGVPVYRQWGLRGLQASAVAWECSWRQGFHLQTDCFWAEVVSPDTLQPLPWGEEGELVLTALHRRSTPAIRLRTGWQGRLLAARCRCGSALDRKSVV